MKQQALQKGFTMIEILIVVAIIAVIAGFAVPQVQDYLTRSKVTEGLNLASAAKTAVLETFHTQGVVPTSNAAAGYPGLVGYRGDNVNAIDITDEGAIRITYKAAAVAGQTLIITPSIDDRALTPGSNGVINWVCKSAGSTSAHYGSKGTLEARFAPSTCNN